MPATPSDARAEIVVDLGAIRHNVARLRELVTPAALMVVVKADGYGHGMVPVGRAAREAARVLPCAICLWAKHATKQRSLARHRLLGLTLRQPVHRFDRQLQHQPAGGVVDWRIFGARQCGSQQIADLVAGAVPRCFGCAMFHVQSVNAAKSRPGSATWPPLR